MLYINQAQIVYFVCVILKHEIRFSLLLSWARFCILFLQIKFAVRKPSSKIHIPKTTASKNKIEFRKTRDNRNEKHKETWDKIMNYKNVIKPFYLFVLRRCVSTRIFSIPSISARRTSGSLIASNRESSSSSACWLASTRGDRRWLTGFKGEWRWCTDVFVEPISLWAPVMRGDWGRRDFVRRLMGDFIPAADSFDGLLLPMRDFAGELISWNSAAFERFHKNLMSQFDQS